jgi:adenine phosphoribosyltransferase
LENKDLAFFIRDVPNFPKDGILFKDITPLLADTNARDFVVSEISNFYSREKIEAVVAIEARGFIFGSLIASAMNVPFIPIRKEGKLPYKTLRQEYNLEYGNGCLEIHEDALSRGQRVLIHDDLLATGGTAMAAADLISKMGANLIGFSFIVNLSFLPGEQILLDKFLKRPHYLINY